MLDAGIAQSYIDILHEELVLATGCTEPIAIAYCAATLQRLLGCKAERVEAVLSGNILKNVKSVVVPNTGGRKGIRPAIAAGMVAGDPSRGLQVISQLPEEKLPELEVFLKTTEIDVLCGESPCRLDIDLRAWGGEHSARARTSATALIISAKSRAAKRYDSCCGWAASTSLACSTRTNTHSTWSYPWLKTAAA